MEFVSIEELVPRDHLLRKIDKVIDFGFIREKVKGLYCADNGRPAVDPVVLFKMLFIGYLYGVRSERQLIRDIQVNVAYRWFLGYGLTAKIPDASTISQNRRRRFAESSIYQEIFDEIVLQAMRRKMVEGTTLYTDSTHLKANANKHKFQLQDVQKSTRDYLETLEEDVARDREAHGKKPLKEKESTPEVKETKVSTTDPDSGYMVREGKPEGFFYLDHRTVDSRYNIITDTFVTPGNVHDSIPYLNRLDRQRERFGFDIAAVFADNNGGFQFKIQFFKMIGHAIDIAWSLYAVVIGEIKDRVLVKLRDHFHFAVSSCSGHMLPKGITVPAGRRKGNRCDQFHLAERDSPVAGAGAFFQQDLTSLGNRISIFPVG